MKRMLLWVMAITVLSGCTITHHPTGETKTYYSPDWLAEDVADASKKNLVDPDNRRFRSSQGTIELYFVHVGQGDCTLIKWPDNTWSMIDCGTQTWGSTLETPRIDFELVREYVHDVLGPAPRLRSLIITHADADHINLLPYVLEDVAIEQVYYTDTLAEHKKRSAGPSGWSLNGRRPSIDVWLKRFPNKTRLTESLIDLPGNDSNWFEDSECKVYMLAANVGSGANDKSVVILLEYGGFRAMLTGDATFETEQFVTERFPEDFLDVDVYKIGHHGSGSTSTSPEWASVVEPELSISSNGYKNGHGHPRWEVINRLGEYAESSHPPHKLRGYIRQGRYKTVSSYSKDIFTTGSNGNIVVVGRRSGSYAVRLYDN